MSQGLQSNGLVLSTRTEFQVIYFLIILNSNLKVIFLANWMSPALLVSTAISTFGYMALTPIIEAVVGPWSNLWAGLLYLGLISSLVQVLLLHCESAFWKVYSRLYNEIV
jgi:hypothetical protein